MPELKEDTEVKIPLKTLITIIIAIVIWVFSLAGVYFTLKSTQNNLKDEVATLKTQIQQSNLSVLIYKVDEIQKAIDKLSGR
jgi:flagellar basal body-associated protein FliL